MKSLHQALVHAGIKDVQVGWFLLSIVTWTAFIKKKKVDLLFDMVINR
jgi:hypothetical protein